MMYVSARNAARTKIENIEKAAAAAAAAAEEQQQQGEDNDEQEDEPVELVEDEDFDPEKYFPGQVSRRNPSSWTMRLPRQRMSCEFSALVALALVALCSLPPSPPLPSPPLLAQASPSTATGATGPR